MATKDFLTELIYLAPRQNSREHIRIATQDIDRSRSEKLSHFPSESGILNAIIFEPAYCFVFGSEGRPLTDDGTGQASRKVRPIWGNQFCELFKRRVPTERAVQVPTKMPDNMTRTLVPYTGKALEPRNNQATRWECPSTAVSIAVELAPMRDVVTPISDDLPCLTGKGVDRAVHDNTAHTSVFGPPCENCPMTHL
jgi:hypothetical protein